MAQLLLILFYGASVAASVIGLKRISGRPPLYFSGLFFLALCPFLFLFFATVIRLAPIFYHVDEIANAQALLSDAVAPFYLGAGTTVLLVVLYSFAYSHGRRV